MLSRTKTKTSRYITSLKADIKLHKIFVDLARSFGLAGGQDDVCWKRSA